MECRQHALELNAKPELHWDEYWLNIRNTTTPTGEDKYPVLMAFVSILASLPFSNPSVENFLASSNWSNQIRDIL